MPSLTNINQRVTERIRKSSLTLTVYYPEQRPVATGTSPGIAPVNPLSGPALTEIVFPSEGAGYKASVTVPCLWLDSTAVTQADSWVPRQAGWVADAVALARVLVSDAALDPANPFGGTIFDGSDHIVFNNTRYTVGKVTPVSASFGLPISFHIWVMGVRRV